MKYNQFHKGNAVAAISELNSSMEQTQSSSKSAQKQEDLEGSLKSISIAVPVHPHVPPMSNPYDIYKDS